MESNLDLSETQTQKRIPKPFSIESLIGDRKSPEIDIENNVSESSKTSEDEDNERLDGLNQMRYYAPFLQQNGFPFLLGYPEPWLRVLGTVPTPARDREEKRESPVSVGSEAESDGGEDTNPGLCFKFYREWCSSFRDKKENIKSSNINYSLTATLVLKFDLQVLVPTSEIRSAVRLFF